ncbi:hypothetical protein BK816_08865 [Boudabousia tangfeifanii]|uniref:Oligopeptidase B n=1 Tax=Boudabousia tangfeifanii TaxID=1912795 RepID=A0A1D9MM98_9ACTO|nr:S9 family peptidase [Boudabousia tangfeifanii]AOZ73368.1 hypothetical protein BK816_08865 [Boudabousia tangfeifanii]
MENDSRTPMSQPPVAEKRPENRTHHGHAFVDPWEWLRDKENPEVISLIEAENQWTEQNLAATKTLQDTLVDEYRAHTKLDDTSVPTRIGNWWYYAVVQTGKDYPIYLRTPADQENYYQEPPKVNPDNPTELPDGTQAHLLVDVNALAQGESFTSTTNHEISPDARYYTYAVDHSGDERFTQYVLDTVSGQIVDQIENVVYGVAWSASSNCLYYVRADEAWRSHQVWLHRLGQPAETDELIYQEDDETFNVGIEASRDGNWIIMVAGATNTSETWLIDAHAQGGTAPARPTSVAGRHKGVEYQVEPAGDHLLIVHNLNEIEGELAWAPLPAPGVTGSPSAWQSLLKPVEGQRFLSISACATHATLELRSNASAAGLYLLPDPEHKWVVEGQLTAPGVAEDAPLTVYPQPGGWWWNPLLRYAVTSLKTAPTILEIDPTDAKNIMVRKTTETPGFNPDDYLEERQWATAEDGTKIPLTVIRRVDLDQQAPGAGVIYGYGSYEISIDPTFSSHIQSLLDRGVTYAIAHPRGGGEQGRAWYEHGRMEFKRNTFTDFIACAQHLITSGQVAANRLAALGGSAGGLLMGAVANLAPQTFRAIAAMVPFVDALNTILRPELPLTVGEWDEWGNPLENADVYQYMRSYSPYENVAEGVQYPAILATTSLNDTRVFYVEPLKWIQRLREATTNNPTERPLLYHCEMVAGHAGKSGREGRWEEYAQVFSFLLGQIEATELTVTPNEN